MRGNVPGVELLVARDLSQSLELVGKGYHPFAGGTDLMVFFEAGVLKETKFVSLHEVTELRGIQASPQVLKLGAMTSYSEVRKHPVILSEFPLLAEAAKWTGAVAIQNRGTIGGNIANASPAADTPPALLVYETEIELAGPNGKRTIEYSSFHTAYRKTAMKPGEIITGILLKRKTQGLFQHYHKVGTRTYQSISKTCFAGVAKKTAGKIEDIRIAFGSVAPIPLRCVKTEKTLQSQRCDDAKAWERAIATLETEITPITDIRSSDLYRRKVSGNLLREFLEKLSGAK